MLNNYEVYLRYMSAPVIWNDLRRCLNNNNIKITRYISGRCQLLSFGTIWDGVLIIITLNLIRYPILKQTHTAELEPVYTHWADPATRCMWLASALRDSASYIVFIPSCVCFRGLPLEWGNIQTSRTHRNVLSGPVRQTGPCQGINWTFYNIEQNRRDPHW
jgi:hypothetical protein